MDFNKCHLGTPLISPSHCSLFFFTLGSRSQSFFSFEGFSNDSLLCMTPHLIGEVNNILVGGEMPSLFSFDVEKRQIVNEVRLLLTIT